MQRQMDERKNDPTGEKPRPHARYPKTVTGLAEQVMGLAGQVMGLPAAVAWHSHPQERRGSGVLDRVRPQSPLGAVEHPPGAHLPDALLPAPAAVVAGNCQPVTFQRSKVEIPREDRRGSKCTEIAVKRAFPRRGCTASSSCALRT